MKEFAIFLVIVVLIAGGAIFYFTGGFDNNGDADTEEPTVEVSTTTDATGAGDIPEENTDTEEAEEGDADDARSVLGRSVEDREIVAYHYGEGDIELLFVGGIHGGYSWNTVLVAYELMEYLEENPDSIPEGVRVSVVPVLNPDGLYAVTGTTERFEASDVSSDENVRVAGRFNANDVDLNRNFDCDWQSQATWQSRTVDGGDEAFSEPESEAIKAYIESEDPEAVVVWYSAAGGVFASNCHGGVLEETRILTNLYADASGYRAYEDFDFYEVTGDMVNWLAKNSIPAISVLLTNHTDVEWSKNRAGIDALLQHYAEE